ncbi:MAG: hypothetical protein NTV63_02645 [Candidatus Woesearchaeota archaeon]|nr:hypothetical protein [Candidatus Woesearchaeota archaeon]
MTLIDMSELLDLNASWGKSIMLVGPMNAGKTEKAIRWAQGIKYHTDCSILAFKPDIDKRALPDKIVANTSEGRLTFDAITISSRNPSEAVGIVENSSSFIDVVLFDEVNFFDVSIIDVFEKLKRSSCGRKRVIIGTGLDKSFRGEPFEPVPFVTAKADITESQAAYCKHIIKENDRIHQCKKPAKYTMRLIADEGNEERYDFFDKSNNPILGVYRPARYYDPTVVIEKIGQAKEKSSAQQVYYISVCPDCFLIPGKEETARIYDFIRERKGVSIDDIVKEFPSPNTERIADFLYEEGRVVSRGNVLFPQKYVFSIGIGAYVKE